MTPGDDSGRGTLMALMASRFAPEAEIRTYRTGGGPDSPYEYWPAMELAQAIYKAADDGNDFILTGAAFSGDFPFLKQACQSAYLRNVVIIAPNGLLPSGKAEERPAYPAAYNSILAVAGAAAEGKGRPLPWALSSPSKSTSVAAPAFPGAGIPPSNAYAVSACGGLAALLSPHIPKTGKELPGQYVQRIAEILQKSADPKILGFATFNPKIGYGLIDAEKAVGPAVQTYTKKMNELDDTFKKRMAQRAKEAEEAARKDAAEKKPRPRKIILPDTSVMEVLMKRRFPVIPVLLVFLLLPLAARGQAGKKPLTLEEMISLKSIGTVALSPSGQMVAFDVTSVDWPRNTFTSDVWLADTAGRQCFAVTKGPDMSMAAAWSPDGQALTFLSTRLGKPQLFIFRPGQGEAGAPHRGAGRRPEIRLVARRKVHRLPDARDPRPGQDESPGARASTPWTSTREGRARRCRSSTSPPGPRSRWSSGDFHIMGFSWSPDGSRLAFVTSPKNLEPVTWDFQTLRVVNRDGSGMKALDFRYYAAFTRRGEAAWSPDGRYLSLEVGDLGKPELHNHIIQVYDFQTGQGLQRLRDDRSFPLQLPMVRRRRRHLLRRLSPAQRPDLPARRPEEGSPPALPFPEDGGQPAFLRRRRPDDRASRPARRTGPRRSMSGTSILPTRPGA